MMKAKVITVLQEVYRVFRDIYLFPRNLFRIRKIVNGVSYYPDRVRKSKKRRFVDNIIYLLKYHEVNIYYNSYGLDVNGLCNEKDYIPHRKFVLSRERGNQKVKSTATGEYNYIVLLRDKYVFSAYLASVIGQKYIPKSVGILCNNSVFLVAENTWISHEKFFKYTARYVFKKIDGECADGVYLVEISNGMIEYDGAKESWNEYCKKNFFNRILIQEIIQQHEKIAILNPYCVNTIRIVTLSNDLREIGVFSAFLRLGVTRDSFVDNRAKGGIGVGINLSDGRLKSFGFAHDAFGTKLEAHPLTGIVFKDYQIPFWDEVKALVINAHKQFYELQSIGWDIVISPNGPVILEGNDDWEIGGPQDTGGGLRQKWMQLTGRKI